MDKQHKLKQASKTKKGKRMYADPKSTLLTHPTRQNILQTLKEGKKTTKELEKITGENRVNLYHHLNLLEAEEIISAEVKYRQKIFKLKNEDKLRENTLIKINLTKGTNINTLISDLLKELINLSDKVFPSYQKEKIDLDEIKQIIIEFEN